MFTKKQIVYMQSLGLNLNFDSLSCDDWVNIEDTVADRLQYSGFDERYNVTEDGKMCESILNQLR
jgi:hypothetical protein